MKELAQIGSANPDIAYVDRQTVKAVVCHNDQILIMNGGFLPGGGVEPGETNEAALRRELMEELGVTAGDLTPIGTVIQYRDLLGKKYIVDTYKAAFKNLDENATARQTDELDITYEWIPLHKAQRYINTTLADYTAAHPIHDKVIQGRIYNMQTTLAIVSNLVE